MTLRGLPAKIVFHKLAMQHPSVLSVFIQLLLNDIATDTNLAMLIRAHSEKRVEELIEQGRMTAEI